MKKFLETQKWSYLTQEETENLYRCVTGKEIELIIENIPKRKSPGPDDSTGKFYHLEN